MIGRIIHWVYCLPIRDAVVIGLLFTQFLFWLHKNHAERKWCKPLLISMALLWAVGMLTHTLLNRSGQDATSSLIPFQTYITVLKGGEKELLRSAFMNVLLFYPGGLLLMLLFPRWKGLWVAVGLVLTSVTIELLQYRFSLGYAELDDVLHNGLGAVLGTTIARLYHKNNPPEG